MEFSLDQDELNQIRTVVLSTVKNAIDEANTNSCPYVNRTKIAKYFGVSQSTIGYWAELGMPVAVIDGRKLYGKQSITQWLKDHEKPSIKHQEQQKKLATIGTSRKQQK